MPHAASTGSSPRGCADALGDRAPRRVPVEPHLAAEEEVGVEIAEHEVGVGHGRLGAAEAVGHGTGAGARALRPHHEPAQRVHAGDGASAGADLDHLDDRDLDREPAALLEVVAAVDLELRRDQRLAVRDHARLGGGAAHVEGEEVLVAEEHAVVGGGEGAGGGAGLDEPDGIAAARLGLAEAAVRLHDEEPPADADPAEPVAEPPQVALRQALHVDVGERRGRALVLADLRHELARQRHRDLGERLAEDPPHQALVGRIRVRVEQAHAHRLDPLGAQPLGEAPDLVGIDGAPHGAVDQDPLVDLEAEVARRDRPRPLHVEVVHVVAMLAGDLHGVAEALGRDEGGPRALALDEGVREERGAVEDVGHLAGGHVRRAEDGFDPRDHGVVRPVGGGEDLADLERPAVLAGEDQVGEGAADVRAHAVHGVRPARSQSRGQAQTLISRREGAAVKLRA